MPRRQSSQRQVTRRTTRKRRRSRAHTVPISAKKRAELVLKEISQEDLDELARNGI